MARSDCTGNESQSIQMCVILFMYVFLKLFKLYNSCQLRYLLIFSIDLDDWHPNTRSIRNPLPSNNGGGAEIFQMLQKQNVEMYQHRRWHVAIIQRRC